MTTALSALDTRREPVFNAAKAFAEAPGATAAAKAVAALQAGVRAGQAALRAQTGDALLPATAAASCVPASALPCDADGVTTSRKIYATEGDCPPPLGDFAVIVKHEERQADLKVSQENGKVDIVGPCFTSLVHRSLLARGKWMYEVQLQSEGLQQIGWSAPHDRVHWTPSLGVGDFVHTLAYDGHRRKLWKGGQRSNTVTDDQQQQQGGSSSGDTAASELARLRAPGCTDELIAIPSWCDGDIITVCADLDAGIATYYANGALTARTSLACLQTMADDEAEEDAPLFLVCAAVSVARGEYTSLNMGNAPFA